MATATKSYGISKRSGGAGVPSGRTSPTKPKYAPPPPKVKTPSNAGAIHAQGSGGAKVPSGKTPPNEAQVKSWVAAGQKRAAQVKAWVHPGQHYVPGKPGTPAKPAQPAPAATPFLTPEQEGSRIQETYNWGNTISGLNRTLSDTAQNTAYSEFQNQLAAKGASARANDSAAGRGIFGSGINLSDLNDISTTLLAKNSILDTHLATLRQDTADRVNAANLAHMRMGNTYNQEAVTNAENLTPDLTQTPAVPATQPTAGQWANNPGAPAAPTAPAARTTPWTIPGAGPGTGFPRGTIPHGWTVPGAGPGTGFPPTPAPAPIAPAGGFNLANVAKFLVASGSKAVGHSQKYLGTGEYINPVSGAKVQVTNTGLTKL